MTLGLDISLEMILNKLIMEAVSVDSFMMKVLLDLKKRAQHGIGNYETRNLFRQYPFQEKFG